MQNANAIAPCKIPSYPQFTQLNLGLKDEVEKVTNRYLRYSDYSFFSMLTYDTNSKIQLSLLNDSLVVKFEDYLTSQPFYSFLGTTDVENSISTLLDISASEGLEPKLKLIPEVVLSSIKNETTSRYCVSEDVDNNDYLYNLTDYVALAGSKYRSQREQINYFTNHYADVVIKPVDALDMYNEAMELFQIWKEGKEKRNKLVEGVEDEAFSRAIKFSPYFNVLSVALFDNSKLISLAVTDLSNNYPTGAFIKADLSYKNILKYSQHAVAKMLLEKGYQEMNCEQDLGLPGLRETKESWNPSGYLKKYTISPI